MQEFHLAKGCEAKTAIDDLEVVSRAQSGEGEMNNEDLGWFAQNGCTFASKQG